MSVKKEDSPVALDVLSWELFEKGASKRKNKIPNTCTLDNRLILATKSFFVVGGLGAFIPGYYLIITKNFYSSFAQLTNDEVIEFEWLISLLNKSLIDNYSKNSAIFEHGMCSCAGGLDHAHVHMMPVPKRINTQDLEEIIDKVLKKRSAGVHKIEFNNHTFDNVHDISSIINFQNNYKILEGKLLKFKDLKNFNDNFSKIRNLLLSEEQYINFSIPSKDFLFCTKHYLGTQFGRELVSEVIYKFDENIRKLFSSLNRSNPTKLIWRWQDYNFENNILQTIKDLSLFVEKNKKDEHFKKYQVKNFAKL